MDSITGHEGYCLAPMPRDIITCSAPIVASHRLKNGDIVVASVNGRLMVRFYKKNDYIRWLVPANSKYQDIEITPEAAFELYGVVKHVINPSGNLRQYMR